MNAFSLPSGDQARLFVPGDQETDVVPGDTCVLLIDEKERPWYVKAWQSLKARIGL